MQYKPHDYQAYAQQFIIDHPACGLLLDLGLGKTVITLSALWDLIFDYFDVDRVLIIAPVRVARDTWPAEIKKWDHLKGLTYSLVMGSPEERKAALRKKALIYITNREQVPWLVESGLFDFRGCCIVCDELSSFKNPKSQRFKALRKVRGKAARIIGLTATPASNGLQDLWAQINLLDMGERLGRYISGYRERYFVPDKRNREVVFSYKPKPGAEGVIYRTISDICVSMKGSDFLTLPDKVVTNVEVHMSPRELKMYEQLREDLVLSLPDGDIDAQSAVGLSNKLLQMANGAVYDEGGKIQEIHSQKLDELESIIEQANGKPILVAYWYRHDADRIEKRLDQMKIPFSRISSSESIKKWNRGEYAVGLIHPASAGFGLNLQQGGCHIVWFGLTWSLELYSQLNGRLYRQGQQNIVTIQHIIAKGTIDEDVLQALEGKDCTQEALLQAVKARIGGSHESRNNDE